jgi:hypothetical protein
VFTFKVLPLGSYALMRAPSPPFRTLLEMVLSTGFQSCRHITPDVISHWGLDLVNREGVPLLAKNSLADRFLQLASLGPFLHTPSLCQNRQFLAGPSVMQLIASGYTNCAILTPLHVHGVPFKMQPKLQWCMKAYRWEQYKQDEWVICEFALLISWQLDCCFRIPASRLLSHRLVACCKHFQCRKNVLPFCLLLTYLAFPCHTVPGEVELEIEHMSCSWIHLTCTYTASMQLVAAATEQLESSDWSVMKKVGSIQLMGAISDFTSLL